MCDHLTCTSAEVWALPSEPQDFYPQSRQTGRAPLSFVEFVDFLSHKPKEKVVRADETCIRRNMVLEKMSYLRERGEG